MKILFLAPQPFFQERGTPIAVDLLLKVLSDRGENIDLVTYHIGQDVDYDNVAIHRISEIPFIRTVSPGFSFRKLICDFFLFWKATALLSKFPYHVIHAVEESVFMAFVFKKIWKIEYIYDMDSHLSAQLFDKHPSLRPMKRFFTYLENKVIRDAKLILPVNRGLVEDFEDLDRQKIVELHDVSLLQEGAWDDEFSIREEMGQAGILVMYVGNLESYQGIDLLLMSFAEIAEHSNDIKLVIIGGKPDDIRKYKQISQELEISSIVRFIGPKPLRNLGYYLSQADILVSPRISGTNTPMKIYSFLESGKAIVATNLSTHTQVLNEQVAVLTEPSPREFAKGILLVAKDANLRKKIGENGKSLAQEKFTLEEFQASVNQIYDSIEAVPAH